jgi:hypothetical protein
MVVHIVIIAPRMRQEDGDFRMMVHPETLSQNKNKDKN